MGIVLPFQTFLAKHPAKLAAPLPGLDDSFLLGHDEVRSLDLDEALMLFSDAQMLHPTLIESLLTDLKATSDAEFAFALNALKTTALSLLDEEAERKLAQALLECVLSARSLHQRQNAALTLSEVFGALSEKDLQKLTSEHDNRLETGLLLCLQAEPGRVLPSFAQELLTQGEEAAQHAFAAVLQTGMLPDEISQQALCEVALSLNDEALLIQLPTLLALLEQEPAHGILQMLVEKERMLPVLHALRFAPHLMQDAWLSTGLAADSYSERLAVLAIMEQHPQRKWLSLLLPQMQDEEPRFRRQLKEVVGHIRRNCCATQGIQGA